jgi:hypothetical protein
MFHRFRYNINIFYKLCRKIPCLKKKSLSKKTAFIRALVSHYNEKGIVVPSIKIPITKRQERKVKRCFKKLKENLHNSVEGYWKIRKLVKKSIKENLRRRNERNHR